MKENEVIQKESPQMVETNYQEGRLLVLQLDLSFGLFVFGIYVWQCVELSTLMMICYLLIFCRDVVLMLQ